MLLALLLLVYLNLWLSFTLNLYGAAQIYTILVSLISLLFIPISNNSNIRLKNYHTILILPIILIIANIFSFFIYGEVSNLARCIYVLTPCILLLSVINLKVTKPVKFLKYFLFLFTITNLVSVTFLSTFSIAHSKFIPAVDWAFVTSNNISYHTTLLGFMLISCAYLSKKLFRTTVFIVSIFSLIHLSKSHISFLLVSILISLIIQSKTKVKASVFLLSILFYFIILTLDIKSIVDQLDLKPISRVYYGLVDLPYLIDANGWKDGLLLSISEIGDETRSDIYLNGFNNLWQIGIFGSDPIMSESVFNGRDYHNTFLYLAYEYGLIGIIYFIIFNFTIAYQIFKLKNRFLKFLASSSFIYYLFRSVFLSVDLVWICVYWFLLLFLCNYWSNHEAY